MYWNCSLEIRRLGRLWKTLILSKWNPIFENLPIESVIKEHQAGYYQALEKSDQLVESTPFVEFMLNIILEVLQEILSNTQYVPINAPINRQERIMKLIAEDKHITLDQLAPILEVSRKTIQRDIRTLKELGKIERIGSLKSGHWKIIKTEA